MVAALNSIVLDLGTTAVKAAVCSHSGDIIKLYSKPAAPIKHNNGQFSSDAMDYLAIVEQLLAQCQQFSPGTYQLGISYQRSSFVVWNMLNGRPVTALISWQDNRGDSCCKALKARKNEIMQLAGLPLTAYYFAPKLNVLLQQQPELRQGLLDHTLTVGTLDSFLIWHWTSGKHFLTDASMAARTLLMDSETAEWSNTLSSIFNIPIQLLADICASNRLNLQLQNRMVLMSSVADQSAALLASIKNDDSEVLVNLGTGGFVIRYASGLNQNHQQGYLKTLVYQDSNKGKVMALEGTLNSISAALQPYPFKSCKIADLARFDDLYCIAEPSGLGAPFFRSDLGLRYSKSVADLTQQQIACLLIEGIIFRVAMILEDFNQQKKINKVFISGGLSTLPCIQQGIALCSPSAVFKLQQEHAGLQGVASLIHAADLLGFRKADRVLVSAQDSALIEKFQRWKVWFKQLLI